MCTQPHGPVGKSKALETARKKKLLSSDEHLKKCIFQPPSLVSTFSQVEVAEVNITFCEMHCITIGLTSVHASFIVQYPLLPLLLLSQLHHLSHIASVQYLNLLESTQLTRTKVWNKFENWHKMYESQNRW